MEWRLKLNFNFISIPFGFVFNQIGIAICVCHLVRLDYIRLDSFDLFVLVAMATVKGDNGNIFVNFYLYMHIKWVFLLYFISRSFVGMSVCAVLNAKGFCFKDKKLSTLRYGGCYCCVWRSGFRSFFLCAIFKQINSKYAIPFARISIYSAGGQISVLWTTIWGKCRALGFSSSKFQINFFRRLFFISPDSIKSIF